MKTLDDYAKEYYDRLYEDYQETLLSDEEREEREKQTDLWIMDRLGK